MHHVEFVGPRQRTTQLVGHVQRAHRVKRARVQHLPQRITLEVLHHQEHETVRGLAEVRDVDDVLVIDAVGSARFAQKALARIGVTGVAGRQELERHVAPDQLMATAVDRPHAACANQLGHHVTTADGPADEWIRQRLERRAI